MSKALVVFSGGQDSTTCLYWAKKNFDEVYLVSFLYGQRHNIEIDAAKNVAKYAGVSDRHHFIETDILKKIGGSSLLDESSDMNQVHSVDSKLPASFVPGRNVMFLSIAASLAYVNKYFDSDGQIHLVTGVCETDFSGYPDCRQSTITSLEETLKLGLDTKIQIHTPLMYLNKKETVELAQTLPGCLEALGYSHTCYEGQNPPCGVCPACKLRARGFQEAGVEDPIFTMANKA